MAPEYSNTMRCCRSGYRRTCTLTRPSSTVTRRRPTSSRLRPFGLTRCSKARLEADAHVWWDYWGSGKKVLHDFATRVTGQPVSIGSAERCWEACANIHCAKRNRLGPERAAKLTCVQYNMRLRHAWDHPTFEPVFLPPMVLDPIDAEADDFDEGSESD